MFHNSTGIYVRFHLAAKSSIVITVFATITLILKHRPLGNGEIHFVTSSIIINIWCVGGGGGGAISTFAEFYGSIPIPGS